jgi:hypothetical protein
MSAKGLKLSLLSLAMCGLGAAQSASAVTFATASGPIAASVSFNLVGGNLEVILTNTGTGDVTAPNQVLTAVFFDISGADPTLNPLSAVLNGGSTVFYDADGQPAGGVVGGEWAYASGLSGAPLGADYGISSSGFGLFGPGDLFPGADLEDPVSPDGVQYGLLSAGDNTATGNGGITGSGGLIKNSVKFTLDSVPTGFLVSQISNVSFQYGTGLDEPNIPAIPEPETYAMLLAGLGLMGFVARRRSRKQAS